MALFKTPYRNHARRHLPGGSDPLPDMGLPIGPYSTGETDIVTIPGDGTEVDVEFSVSPNGVGLTAGGAPPQRDWTIPTESGDVNYLLWLYFYLSSLTGGEAIPSFWYVKMTGSWTGQIFSFPVNPATGDNPGIFIPLPMFSDGVFGCKISQDTGVDHTMSRGHFIIYATTRQGV